MPFQNSYTMPPSLAPGAVVGITCPSGYVAASRVAHAITVLQQWGYRVQVGKTVGNEHHYFAGTDADRLADLQAMLDDPSIDAILMGRGGYGMSRIIDQLDFTAFLQRPKWVCGFSDITVLHSHLHAQYGIATLHSPMCGAFKPETETADYILSLQKALCGHALQYPTMPHPLNRTGQAQGVLTGGNLAILAHLTGSQSEVDTTGKILFIEDISEYLYAADRLLMNLKRAGKLHGLAALVVGSFTDMQDTERPFGQTIEEIVADKVREYNYPVCFGLQAGHQEVNFTLTLGAVHHLQVGPAGGMLSLVR
jgi:muramoyltetrapeptide carboxypeptidase